jgi:ATP-binding cassette, subfamily B (MDR/TAP), member 1
MLGSFLLLYCILALYGTALLYKDIEDSGCDPSGIVPDNDTCTSNGADVFGAMLGMIKTTIMLLVALIDVVNPVLTFVILHGCFAFSGIAFAAQGVSQFGSFSEAFTQARVAVYGALKVIRRKPGAPEETVYRTDEDDIDAPMNSTTHSKKSNAVVNSRGEPENAASTIDQPVVKAILPKFEIDTSSTDGLKPIRIQGHISFKNVTFSYPTRPHETVLNGMSTEIFAGKTVAFVGPRYDVGSR